MRIHTVNVDLKCTAIVQTLEPPLERRPAALYRADMQVSTGHRPICHGGKIFPRDYCAGV